jgi:DNA-binding transcriptional ArsR family regulator
MSAPDGPFDPGRFRLDPIVIGAGTARQRRRLATSSIARFIAGPVYVAWLRRARTLGVTALWVGLGLWFLRGLQRKDSFLVSNLAMQAWEVGPDAKSRALRALERAGLITVERRGRRSPSVTILPAGGQEPIGQEADRSGSARLQSVNDI